MENPYIYADEGDPRFVPSPPPGLSPAQAVDIARKGLKPVRKNDWKKPEDML